MFDWVFLPQMFLYYLLFIGIIIILRKRKIPWLYTFSIACLCVMICSEVWEVPIHIESWLNGTFEWKYVTPKLLAVPLLGLLLCLCEWQPSGFLPFPYEVLMASVIFISYIFMNRMLWAWLARIYWVAWFVNLVEGFVSDKYDLWVKTFNDKDVPQKKTQKTCSKQTNNQN